MKLTGRDGFATIAMALIVLVYVLFLGGADFLLVSSVQATTTTILVLGIIGCSLGAADELYTATKSAATRAFAVVGTILGVGALAAMLTALIGGGEAALAVFFTATVALWLLATVRHWAGVGTRPAVEMREEAKTR